MALDAPKNIRISIRADEVTKDLVDRGYFANQVEAYRTAVVLGIAMDLMPDNLTSLNLNKWDTASVFNDATSPVEPLLAIFGHEGDIRYGQSMAESALDYLGNLLASGQDLWPLFLGQTNNI